MRSGVGASLIPSSVLPSAWDESSLPSGMLPSSIRPGYSEKLGPEEVADLALSKARYLLERASTAEQRDKRSGLNTYFKREWGTTNIGSMLKKLPSAMREQGMGRRFFQRKEMSELTSSEPRRAGLTRSSPCPAACRARSSSG
jgi:hypothetical protein